ncbi:DUF4062 domain-containing protein [Curtobacterium flaccumfaciens]|uniref:DUF4062 domain-containing protein n=1 Tax=Curtobacterium flaccumfaciens TaxID=2035 RepID=UPI0021C57B8F|nr:DUF4062 domain-containing protein [Curtobacterium flaccumfaciens]UXN20923.1 DUF4062 domain-containing protein [Curtobacterium flaccumfaciens pv. flaccumfaciens]
MNSETRYQIFVSSTFLDLQAPRAAVVSALLNLDAFPAGMEMFPAADDDAWTLIEDVIRDSDYYLLIIGGKYGSVDPELEISFTEREFDTAVKLGKPVMAFLHGEPGKLLAEQSEDSPARRKKLTAFRKKVESTKHVKYWTSAEDLAGKVALSWNSFRRRYPATGWVRANQLASKESLEALAKAQAEIEALKKQLNDVRTEAPAGAERLAQGSETFVLPVYAKGTWRAESVYNRPIAAWTEVELTWDRVFGYLGLRMMQQANEATLEEDLGNLARLEANDALRKFFLETAREAAKAEGIDKFRWSFTGLDVADEDFQTVLLQFDALGLITHSQRNRSVKDTANYWNLTPYGHTRLVQLRALSKDEGSLQRTVDEDGPEVDGGDSATTVEE